MSNSIKKAAGDVRERIDETLSLADYLAEIAYGVAEAQHALDRQSIRTAKELLDKGLTLHWGISAPWFCIPEVDIELKLALDLKGTHTEKDGPRLICSSGNAKYQNTYNFNINAMSTLKARIVAIPSAEISPPDQDRVQKDYIRKIQEGLKELHDPETDAPYYSGDDTGELEDTKQAIANFKKTLHTEFSAAKDRISLARLNDSSPVGMNPYVYQMLQFKIKEKRGRNSLL